jgi:hypothetical protein
MSKAANFESALYQNKLNICTYICTKSYNRRLLKGFVPGFIAFLEFDVYLVSRSCKEGEYRLLCYFVNSHPSSRDIIRHASLPIVHFINSLLKPPIRLVYYST